MSGPNSKVYCGRYEVLGFSRVWRVVFTPDLRQRTSNPAILSPTYLRGLLSIRQTQQLFRPKDTVGINLENSLMRRIRKVGKNPTYPNGYTASQIESCVHRGNTTGKVKSSCGRCGGSPKYTCAVHGECTFKRVKPSQKEKICILCRQCSPASLVQLTPPETPQVENPPQAETPPQPPETPNVENP